MNFLNQLPAKSLLTVHFPLMAIIVVITEGECCGQDNEEGLTSIPAKRINVLKNSITRIH